MPSLEYAERERTVRNNCDVLPTTVYPQLLYYDGVLPTTQKPHQVLYCCLIAWREAE